MQRTFKTSIGCVAMATAFAMFTSLTMEAAEPQPASGEFVVEELLPTSIEPRGQICRIKLNATFRLEGTFDGTFVADFLIVHHGPCNEPAPQHFVAHGTFTGEAEGAAGSFDFVFVGDIDIEGFAEGDLVIGAGTDDLSRLSGQITLSGLAGVEGSYQGRIHFAP